MKLNAIKVKAIINKANGQINISLPRKQVTKELIEKVYSKKSLRLFLEDMD